MNCMHCGAPLDSTRPVSVCPFCGGLHQSAEVILAQDLRIETINETASVLIPRWSALPAGLVQSFSTGADDQQAVSVHLLQGDDERLRENRNLGLFVFDGIGPARRGEPEIQFSFEISVDGSLVVTARDQKTGKQVTFPKMQVDVRKKPAATGRERRATA